MEERNRMLWTYQVKINQVQLPLNLDKNQSIDEILDHLFILASFRSKLLKVNNESEDLKLVFKNFQFYRLI